MNTSLFNRAKYLFITLSAVAVVFAIPTWAQDEDEDAAELGKIEVTGSRLNQTDIETAQPVTVITREQIELSGFATVAEVLQNTPYNSFGSFRETSGYANGQASVNEISLRGLGSNRTLVLLDGRRIASTGGSGGAAQNLNQIPSAIIDRIEILRDGASAVYGSDAIAGVVNIITRKDFDGMDVSITSGSTEVGGGDYTRANVTGGVSNSKGNIYYTFQHYDRRPQYYNEIPYASHASNYDYFSSFGYPGAAITGLGIIVDPRCPEANVGSSRDNGSNTSSTFPNSYYWAGPGLDTGLGRCGYDFAQDIMSIPRAKRNAFLMKSSYDLSPDVTMNAVVMFSQLEGDSRFAGTPITAPYPVIPSGSPNHPMIAYGYDCTADGSGTGTTPATAGCGAATLLLRSVPNGYRDNTVTENITDVRIGFEGVADMMGGLEWELNVQSTVNDVDNQTINLVNKTLLQAGIDAGTVDPWGINSTLDEVAAQMLAFNHTGLYQADLKTTMGDLIVKFDVGELAGGPIGMVLGVEYSHSDFDQLNDPESNAFLIAGSAGGDNINAQRARKSAYFELGLPFTEQVRVSMAGRYDEYSTKGVGSNFSPSINFEYRPMSWVLLRGTYGEGFRAPAFDELFGNRSESFPTGIDIVGCETGVVPEIDTSEPPDGIPDTCLYPTQYRAFFGGNPDLGPEESEHYTFGAVLSPLPELNIQLNVWHTEFEGLITTSTLGREFEAEARGEVNYVTRCTASDQCQEGTVNFISLTSNNYKGVTMEGLDIDVNYVLDTDNMGRFDMGVNAAKITKYIYQRFASDSVESNEGELGLPDTRMTPYLTWGKGDWAVGLTGYHVSGQETDYFGTPYAVDDSMTFNLRFSYQLPWDASVSVGAINVTNEEPEQNSDWYGWEPFDFGLYDTRGRTVYLTYEQSL
jgi:iron complex outermembrane receptor protein